MSKIFNFIFNLKDSLSETREQKYRREMVKFLSQAYDRIHLEQLEREWEKTHGRLF